MSLIQSIAKEAPGCRIWSHYVLSLCHQDCVYVQHHHHQPPCTLHYRPLYRRSHLWNRHSEEPSAAEALICYSSWQPCFNRRHQCPNRRCRDETHLPQNQQGGKLRPCEVRAGIHTIYHYGKPSPQICCKQGHHRHHDPKDFSHYLQGKLGSCMNGAGVHYGYHDVDQTLECLCEQGHLDKALDILFQQNRAPSTKAYLCLLQACNRSKKNVAQAKKIHAHMVHHNAPITAFLGDCLAMTLAKCGAVDDACQVADSLPRRSVLTWTAIIFAHTECGQAQEAVRLYQRMQEDGVEPNSYTYVSLLKACGSILDLDSGRKIHAEARARGLASHVYVGSTLVSMYGKCGAVAEAEEAFISLPLRDPVSWNSMLTAYVEQNKGEKALRLFRQMQEEAIVINNNSLVFGLQACGILANTLDVDESSILVRLKGVGQALHADVRRRGLAFDFMIGSALVSMYGKCGTTLEADNVFTLLLQHDTVSWNAMLSVYVEQGNEEKALHFYKQMQNDGLTPDETTFVMVLRACGNIAERDAHFVTGQLDKATILELGQAVHADARRLGYASHTQVANTLVSMYGKCGAIAEAEDIFTGMPCPGIVSWTVLLSAYAEQGHGQKAVELYKEMQLQNVTKDEVALVSALQACGATGTLETCRHLHFEIVSAGLDHDIAVATTTLIAYRSCAIMFDAQACFDGLSRPTTALWNACMAGHAGEGSQIVGLSMFENMKAMGIKPNELTFISALSACRNTGLVGASLKYFESMSRDYDISPNAKHFGVVLDLLGRVGDLRKVKFFLERMPAQADMAMWLSLLGACWTHGNLELAKWAFDHAVKLEPKNAGAYVMLSNICRDAGLKDFAAEMEYCMQIQGAVDWEYGHEVNSYSLVYGGSGLVIKASPQ